MRNTALFFMITLPLTLLFFAMGSCADKNLEEMDIRTYDTARGGEDVVLENEYLLLRFFPDTTAFTLTEKSTGIIWRSGPENVASDPSADAITRQSMRSQITVSYADSTGMDRTFNNFQHSVEKGLYQYRLTDGGLEVDYLIGNINRERVFPIALREERMNELFEVMSQRDKNRIEGNYRLYDINRLRPQDNKNALLSSYPDLAQGRVYVFREGMPDFLKVQMEEIFASAGYTRVDFASDSARYRSEEESLPVFNVSVRYELQGNSFLASIPFDRIAYRAQYPLTQLNVLPFFGAGGIDDNGFLFVPDGSGALIEFNNGKQSQNIYNNNVYGWDWGMKRAAVLNDNRAPYPVFGIQKNGAALLGVIEEGSSYSVIRADVSGRNCSWNSVYAAFTLIHGEVMDISAKQSKAVTVYESGPPPGERIAIRFIPCARDSYAGMAIEYRNYLLRTFPLLAEKRPKQKNSVPVAVQIIGAVEKTRQRFGLPSDMPFKLTSFAEAEQMLDDFSALGWENAHIKLSGWFNRSIDHSPPLKIRIIGDLGGKRELDRLTRAVGKYGYTLYAEADFVFMRNLRPFDGFSPVNDAARHISREQAELYPYSFVWFGKLKQQGEKPSYLVRPQYTADAIDQFSANAAGLGFGGIAFRAIGSELAADYNEKRRVSREASLLMQVEKLAELTQRGTGIMVNTGHIYTVPYADLITDMPLTDQGFGITDASVPFYQIALHGIVPYTGRAVNLAEDYTENLLKTIESGAGLYFIFMEEEAGVLQESNYRHFFSCEYDKWIQDADALYRRFKRDFYGLYNQTIEDHRIIFPGLTVTEYADGTEVVVNSGKAAASYRGQNIAPRDYAVFRKDGSP